MGLDMNAWVTKAMPENGVDFQTHNFNPTELHYWRKHPNLHGWMEDLYYKKGGKAESFNCVNVELNMSDLDFLEEDIKNGNLPKTGGFFFGESNGTETEDDLEFISKARKAIEEGNYVYYNSWW